MGYLYLLCVALMFSFWRNLRKTDQAILWSKLYHLFPFPGWRCFSSFVKNSKTTEISRSLFTNLKSKRLLDFIWSSCQVVVLLAGELWSDSWAFLRQHHYTACADSVYHFIQRISLP